MKFLLQKHSKQTFCELVEEKDVIKKNVVSPIPEDEKWKLVIIEELCLLQKGFLDTDFDEPLLEEILEFICTS